MNKLIAPKLILHLIINIREILLFKFIENVIYLVHIIDYRYVKFSIHLESKISLILMIG
jgi:hypothetical protein